MVYDPFSGAATIPIESLRSGAETIAGELNPVAFLLNKVVLESIPKYGDELLNYFKKWVDHIVNKNK